MDAAASSNGTWVALIAGGAPWTTDEQRSWPAHRLACVFEVWGLLSTALTLWVVQFCVDHGRLLPPIAGTVGVLIMLADPLLRLWNRRPITRSVLINFAVRTIALTCLILAILSIMSGWVRILSVTLPIAIGTDAALTADDLGWRLNPLVWWREFLVSGFHFGVIGAVVASWVLRNDAHAGVVWPTFLLMHAFVIVTLVTAWLLAVILRRFGDERVRLIAGVREDERRRRAHWLHDDVCAEIRLISLRVQTQAAGGGEVVRLLDELDHQLRLRQLDELFVAGSVRAAEVLQPFIRHAQNVGVGIDSVPGFEQAALVLNEPEARLLGRVASVLTSNSLNAGATRMSIAMSSSPTELRLTVTDDGPGFAEDDVQPGRGIWVLREDLRPGGIEIDSSTAGSTVIATISLEERSRLVDDLVG